MNRITLLLAAALVCAACTSDSVVAPADAQDSSDVTDPAPPSFTRDLEPCSFPGISGPILCGAYTVYEDRDARSGHTIEINVLVVKAIEANPEPDPVVYFEGGPGGSSVATARFIVDQLTDVRRRRDLVFVDQRGTGGSGRLACNMPLPGGEGSRRQACLPDGVRWRRNSAACRPPRQRAVRQLRRDRGHPPVDRTHGDPGAQGEGDREGHCSLMRALVTGGAGFIGSHTADALLARGFEVRVLDTLEEPVHPGRRKPDYLDERIELVQGDVRDADVLLMALSGCDVVFHFAAFQDYLPIFSRFFDVNVTGTALIYEIVVREKLPIRKIVVASSQATLGEGL